jgi:hypothetical protein
MSADQGRMSPRPLLAPVNIRDQHAVGIALIPTILQAYEAVVQTWIREHCCNVAGWRIACKQSPRLQTKDTHIILIVQTDEFVCVELYFSYRCPPRCGEGHADSLLAINVYQSRAELGVAGSNSQQGLDRVVG